MKYKTYIITQHDGKWFVHSDTGGFCNVLSSERLAMDHIDWLIAHQHATDELIFSED